MEGRPPNKRRKRQLPSSDEVPESLYPTVRAFSLILSHGRDVNFSLSPERDVSPLPSGPELLLPQGGEMDCPLVDAPLLTLLRGCEGVNHLLLTGTEVNCPPSLLSSQEIPQKFTLLQAFLTPGHDANRVLQALEFDPDTKDHLTLRRDLILSSFLYPGSAVNGCTGGLLQHPSHCHWALLLSPGSNVNS